MADRTTHDPDDDHELDPQDLPASGWKRTLRLTKDALKRDSVPLLAAGVAFYAVIAIFPALVAFVSIYGLVADPTDAERQVTDLLAAAPSEVRELISSQLSSVAESGSAGLGVGAILGVAAALWSASSGMKHLITAVNDAYHETESRGFLKLRGLSLALTVGAIVAFSLAIGAIVVLPQVLETSGLGSVAQLGAGLVRWPLLAAGLLAGLAVLYRYAPNRDEPRWVWVAPGSVVAVIGWLLASVAFSIYASNFASFGETYGSLSAVIVLLLWLMISAAMVLIGAEINSASERVADQRSAQPSSGGDDGDDPAVDIDLRDLAADGAAKLDGLHERVGATRV